MAVMWLLVRVSSLASWKCWLTELSICSFFLFSIGPSLDISFPWLPVWLLDSSWFWRLTVGATISLALTWWPLPPSLSSPLLVPLLPPLAFPLRMSLLRRKRMLLKHCECIMQWCVDCKLEASWGVVTISGEFSPKEKAVLFRFKLFFSRHLHWMMQPPMMVSNGNGTAPFISGRSSYIFGGLVNVVCIIMMWVCLGMLRGRLTWFQLLCWIFPGAGNVIAAVADPWRRILHLVCGFLMVGCMWLLVCGWLWGKWPHLCCILPLLTCCWYPIGMDYYWLHYSTGC